MEQYLEYVKFALASIKNNRGRSLLTMLGIIIGISSVIMVVSIGDGMNDTIAAELENFAGGQFYLGPNPAVKKNEVVLNESAIQLIEEKVAHVKGVTEEIDLLAKAVGKRSNFTIQLHGGAPALEYVFWAGPVAQGRYFTDSDYASARRVCVISEDVAKKLFGTTNAVGMSFEISYNNLTQSFTVIGVRGQMTGGFMDFIFGEGELTVEVPSTALGNCFGVKVDEFEEIAVVADSPDAIFQVAADSVVVLENFYHVRGENKIHTETINEIQDLFDIIMGVLTIFVSLVAAISLIVGGIGVMNIMLVSVTERTREIGIRKSLGARTSSIQIQFLAESGIITLVGGVIGIALGCLSAIGICALLGFSAKIKLSTVIIAAGFSIAVGIFFGMYPAKKAAQLTPVEALRQD